MSWPLRRAASGERVRPALAPRGAHPIGSGEPVQGPNAEDMRAVATSWSRDDIAQFKQSAGDEGIELLMQCRRIAMSSAQGAVSDQDPGEDDDKPHRDDDE